MGKPVKTSSYSVVRRLLLTVAIVVAAIAVPVSVAAESLHDKIDRIQKQIDTNQAEADRLSQRADTLKNKVSGLRSQIHTVQKKIDLNQAKHHKLKLQIQKTQKQINERSEFLGRNLAALYVDSTVSTLEMVAASGSIGDFIDKQEYRSAIRDKVTVAVKEVQSLKKDLTKQQSQVKKILNEQKAQRSELNDKKQELDTLLAQTRGKEARYQKIVEDLKSQKAKAEAALAAALGSGSYKVAPVGPVSAGDIVGGIGSTGLSTGPHLHLEVRRGSGHMDPSPYIKVQPVSMPPAYLSQGYGNGWGIYVGGKHPGIDYAASVGTPIRAIDSGYMYRGCSANLLGTWAYGNVAIIEHSNGTISIYAHMNGNC